MALSSCGIIRIDEHGDTRHPRHQLVQELQPFGRQLDAEEIDPCQVAAGAGEVGDQTKLHRVFEDAEKSWD